MLRLRRAGMWTFGLGIVGLLGGLAVAQNAVPVQFQPVQPGGIMPGGKEKVPGKPGEKSSQFSAIKLIEDSKYRGYINTARGLIKGQQWEDSVKVLQAILNTKEDFYVQIREKDDHGREVLRWTSVRFEAQNLLGSMADEGLDVYELRWGGKAQSTLKEAKETGSRELLSEVAHRWFYTKAGVEANDLLATSLLDRGQYFLAALRFEKALKLTSERYKPNDVTLFKAALAYRRSGDMKNAGALWQKVEERLQDKDGLRVGDQVIPLAKLREYYHDEKQPLSFGIYDWPMVRGNSSHSAQAIGSPPLLDQPLWRRQHVLDNDPTLAETEPRFQSEERDVKKQIDLLMNNANNSIAMPGSFPVSANGRLVYRAYGELRCIALNSDNGAKPGDTLWKSAEMLGSITQILKHSDVREVIQPWLTNYTNFPQLPGFGNLVFENTTVGTISTDHQFVYAIDDIAVPSPDNLFVFNPFMGMPQSNVPSKVRNLLMQNCLYAFNLQSGRTAWSLGSFSGADTKDEFSDSHFLGAPINVGGKLYVLNEKNQGQQGDAELRLVCIDPNKVDGFRPHVVEPIQVLGNVEQRNRVTHAISRRINGVHLAYGEGVLVCPTNAGEILGVDLMSRSLAWAYPYREQSPKEFTSGGDINPRNGRIFIGGGGVPSALSMSTVTLGKWKSTPPAIVDGKIVFTAPDADSVHCINLQDGTPRWKVGKLEGDLYFAGVVGKRVVLVGKNHIRALNLDDGRAMWSITTGDVPSGQGIASGGVYYQPLKKGEIIAVDVARGAIKAHNRSKNSNFSPGNLIFSDGAVITLTPYEVVAYPQLLAKLEVADAAVKNDPSNPEKLVDRGEILLADGQVQKAVNDLQQALDNKLPAALEARAKNRLYDAISDILQADFPNASQKYLEDYRKLSDLGESVKEKQTRQAKFFRIVGNGRELEGNLIEAFQMYKEFGSLPIIREAGVASLEDPSDKVPVDVWLRGRVASMFARATPEQRAPLEAKIAEEWKAVEAKNDIDAIRAFVGMFDVPFAVGREARLKLAETIVNRNDHGNFMEAELSLYQLRGQDFSQQAASGGKALAGLAHLEEKRGSTESMQGASAYYRQLARDFPNDVVRGGKTGKDLFSDLAADKRMLPYLEESSSFWNQAPIAARELNGAGYATAVNPQQTQLNVLLTEGDPSPFMRRHRMTLETSSIGLAPKLSLTDLSTGKNRWGPLPLGAFPTNMHIAMVYMNNQGSTPNSNARYRLVQSVGHLAVIQVGIMAYCIDADNGKILWQQSLLENYVNNPMIGSQLMVDGDGNLMLTSWNQQNGQQTNQAIGQVGAVQANYVAIVGQKGLQVLDPVRGNVLWKKADVPCGSRVFGDDQHIFIVEVGEGGTIAATRVLRASDGEPVMTPNFAGEYQSRLQTLGRRILTMTPNREQKTLRLYDIVTGKNVWSKPLDPQATLTATDDPNLIGWVEPNGRLVAIDVPSGKELLSTSVVQGRIPLQEVANLREPLLVADADRFYLALNKSVQANLVNGQVVANNFQNGIRCRQVNGYVLAFHRHNGPVKVGHKTVEAAKGELAWHSIAPIENQMLVTEQFEQLPILLFTSRYNKLTQPGGNHWVASTTALHKQTGKMPYESNARPGTALTHFVNLHADPRQGTINLIGHSYSVQFFVDDGRKVEAPAGLASTGNLGVSPVGNMLFEQRVIAGPNGAVIIRQQAIQIQVAPLAPRVVVPVEKE